MSASSARVDGSTPRQRRSARLRLWWRRYWWIVLTAAALTTSVLAFIGADGDVLTRLDTSLLILPMGNPPDPKHVSRSVQIAEVLAAIVFVYATYRAVFAVFGERLQDIRASLMRNHVVVCGLGNQGQALVESLLGSTKVVAVELDPANLAVRRLRDEGAVVLVSDSTDPETIRKAKVTHASHVVLMCGQDAVNASIGANLLELGGRIGRPFDAFVHITDPRLYTFLLHHSLSRRAPRLEFFNIYERGARGLVDEANLSPNGPPNVVLVVGAGQLGLAVISQLARDRHERPAAYVGVDKLRVHVVDFEARARVRLLADRYSRLPEVCDLEPYEMDVGSPTFDHLLERDGKLEELAVAFVCFDNDTLTIAATLSLLDQAQGRFPVIARVTHRSEGIAGLIERVQSRNADAAVFRPLSLAQRVCRADLVLEGMRGQLAREVHALYRNDNPGGPYDVPWEALPEEGRERNLQHADNIAHQLEEVGYRLGPLIDWGEPLAVVTPDEMEGMSKMEHDRWLRERRGEGWQYGAVRNDDAHVHPDLVSWEELPEERREINRRLVRERPAMLARVGIQIYRG